MCLLAIHSDYHPVGVHEILDGRTFLEKFGIRGYVERYVYATFLQFFPDGGFYFLCRADGYGAFGYQQGVAVDFLSERSRYVQHVMQVGAAVLVRRSSHGAENDFNFIENQGKVGREMETSLTDVFFDKFLESRLINRHDAVVELIDLFRVDIHTGHIRAHFGETGSCNQADISGPNDCNVHIS